MIEKFENESKVKTTSRSLAYIDVGSEYKAYFSAN